MLRVCRHLTARSKFIQHLFRRRRQPRVLRRPRRSRRRRRAHRRHRSSSQRRRPRFPRRRPRLRRSPLILQIHVRSHRQRRRVLCVPLNLRPLPDAVFRHPRRERPRLRLAPRPVQFTTLLPILHRVDTHTHTHTVPSVSRRIRVIPLGVPNPYRDAAIRRFMHSSHQRFHRPRNGAHVHQTVSRRVHPSLDRLLRHLLASSSVASSSVASSNECANAGRAGD